MSRLRFKQTDPVRVKGTDGKEITDTKVEKRGGAIGLEKGGNKRPICCKRAPSLFPHLTYY